MRLGNAMKNEIRALARKGIDTYKIAELLNINERDVIRVLRPNE